jgi:glucose/arabinose dehydrogenase
VRSALAIATVALLAACSSGEPAATEAEPAPTTSAHTGAETTTEDTATEATPPDQPSALKLTRVASGLDSPLHVASTPSEPNRVYVVEQEGLIRVIEGGRVREQPFLDIEDLVKAGGEQGLLSLAFHPDYERNRLFYVNYTDVNGDTRVVEYRARGAPPARTRELLFVEQPYSNHNGGQLAFGPDGLLYVGMGDGGSGGDPENRAQDLTSRLGKLLRLDVDDPSADWRIVAYGLRNPWRFSFDRTTGDLYIGDVGQGSAEEIDYLPRESPGLENYGWDVFEGSLVYEDKEPNGRGRLVAPIAEYDHESGGCSVTGGFVYRGERIPQARGRYFYGDYCNGVVLSLRVEEGRASSLRRERFTVPALSSFGEDAAGELYLVSLEGEVFRLDPR